MENIEKAPRRTINGYVKYNLRRLINDCNSVIQADSLSTIECAETLIRVRGRMKEMLSAIQHVEEQQEYALKRKPFLNHFKRLYGAQKGRQKKEKEGLKRNGLWAGSRDRNGLPVGTGRNGRRRRRPPGRTLHEHMKSASACRFGKEF